MLSKNPEIVHRVKIKLGLFLQNYTKSVSKTLLFCFKALIDFKGTHMIFKHLFHENWPEWKEMSTVHLLINHRIHMDKQSNITEFDEENIKTHNYTYGEMCRQVLKRIETIETSKYWLI
jgi:hypothetical protein